jgi:hypothetical protein
MIERRGWSPNFIDVLAFQRSKAILVERREGWKQGEIYSTFVSKEGTVIQRLVELVCETLGRGGRDCLRV